MMSERSGGQARPFNTLREKFLIVAGAGGLVVILAGCGVLTYALCTADMAALRWWAALATVGLPAAFAAGYYAAKIEARGHLEGLRYGVEEVARAAEKTAQIRADYARQTRVPWRWGNATTPVQQFILPAPPPGGYADVIQPGSDVDA